MGQPVSLPDVWRGRVLRAWREYQDLSEQSVATAMGVTRAAVSNWERGRRTIAHWEDGVPRPGPADGRLADRFVAALDLSPAHVLVFHSMLASAGSVGVPPRQHWEHNFPPPSGPVWVWLRPGPGDSSISAAARWGEPLQGTFHADVQDAGVFIQMPSSVPNPPLEVLLSTAGWADFGRGQVPDEVAVQLGSELLDGRVVIAPTFSGDPVFHRETLEERALRRHFRKLRHLGEHFGIRWRMVVPHLREALALGPSGAFDGTTLPLTATAGTSITDEDRNLLSQLTVSRDGVKSYREARGMSRSRAAELATELDRRNPVTERAVETIESGGLPTIAHVIARLDTVYRADGRLGLDRVYASQARPPARREHAITFPEYWVGPIWIRPFAGEPTATGEVQLDWGPWRRRQVVMSGMLLTTRRATRDAEALLVHIPAGWDVVAGTGAHPNALDINHGWTPSSIPGALLLIRQGIKDIWEGAQRDVSHLPRG